MNYIQGTSRDQLYLFATKLNDIIPEEHVVRFIDHYVEKLDFYKLEIHNIENDIGAPKYSPSLYLKIYIYSYLNKIRSSRKIESECKKNIELIWLSEQLAPDHWSISNFRKKNKKALINIFKEFMLFCHKLELLSFECVAIDGTKMRAQNSTSNIYKRDEIEKVKTKIEEKIDEYIKELEESENKEKDEYDYLNKNIVTKLSQIEKHKDKLEFVEKIFKENPEIERYFASDNDSNFQKDNGRCITGYNCQSVVDEKNKLIVVASVTRENNDLHQLNNMIDKIQEMKEELNVEKKTICVADAGYHSEVEIIKANENEKIDVYVPNPRDVKTKEKHEQEKKDKIPSKDYQKEDFKYDAKEDVFICPENKVLTKRGEGYIKDGIKKIKYQCFECKFCEKMSLCTKDIEGRSIEISENFEEMEKFREKVKSKLGKKIIQKRKELVEHPFGTIKRNLGFTYFMQKGKEKVEAEFNFIAFIYNLKRVVNIMGVNKLIEMLQ